jgi:hypothetical protein
MFVKKNDNKKRGLKTPRGRTPIEADVTATGDLDFRPMLIRAYTNVEITAGNTNFKVISSHSGLLSFSPFVII